MKCSEYLTDVFGLEGRVAIVTGGLGRLGTAFVTALAQAGARVAVFDKIAEVNPALAQLATAFPVSFHTLDVTEEDAVTRACLDVKTQWGVPTILINNAGWKSSVSVPGNGGVPFEHYSMEVWDEVFRVNTRSAAVCSKVVGGMLIDSRTPGVIINILSLYAIVAPDQRIYAYREEQGHAPFVKDASYSASKAALLALTRDLAVQWGRYGIRVVGMSPGGIEHAGSDPEFVQRYSERVPLGRMGREVDLCGALLFLASNAASYIHGANLVIDGGWSIL